MVVHGHGDTENHQSYRKCDLTGLSLSVGQSNIYHEAGRVDHVQLVEKLYYHELAQEVVCLSKAKRTSETRL